MSVARLSRVVVALIALAGFSIQNANASESPAFSGEQLIHMLEEGGYVVYFRHGITDHAQTVDQLDLDLDDCKTQRNLSDEGQQQTRTIGQIIKQLAIPVDRVLSSKFCRCLDTAINLTGSQPEIHEALYFAIHLTQQERAQGSATLRRLLSTKPSDGFNTVLVSHTANLKEAADIWPKLEGGAHVFRPDGDSHEYLGAIDPQDWLSLKLP